MGSASKRVKKIRLFLLALVTMTIVLAGGVAWLETSRNTDLADPTAGITDRARESTDTDASGIHFHDVTDEVGLKMQHGPGSRSRLLPEDTGSGLAWNDYDNDGDWDLYVVSFPNPTDGTGGANHLFRNDNGRFTDVTDVAGVADPEGFGMGATFADYDEDGDADLYVTNFGPNCLFNNLGDGTFKEVSSAAGVDDSLWSTGAAWGDFDRDGHLDLYVCNYVRYDITRADAEANVGESSFGRYQVPFTLNPNSFDPSPNRLYRNRGDGTFEEVAVRHGVDNPEGRSFAATFCDLDGDGWLDLYVANDVSENKLFRNTLGDASEEASGDTERPFIVELSEIFNRQNDGSEVAFADLSAVTGTADPRGSMGLSVGDIGQMTGQPDCLPDLFVTHWLAQENALYQTLKAPDGMLEYRDKTRQCRLGEISIDCVGWGCGLVDIDLDGRTDLIVANGSTLECKDDTSRLVEEPIFAFWNDGARFHEVGATLASFQVYSARGLALADFDDDGDVDFAISVNRGRPHLFRNDTPSAGNSLKVRLDAPASLCFGARVEVTVGDRLLTQWYGADVSFLSMHASELVFGLGDASDANQVLVRWGDGSTSSLAQAASGVVEVCHASRSQ